MEYLAILATNLRMALDVKIVIGGEMGAYLKPYLERLREKASKYDRFARDIDYLHTAGGKRGDQAGALGAALLALEKFESRVLE